MSILQSRLACAVMELMSQQPMMWNYVLKPDEVQLAFIQKTQRVLFTQDADFLIIASSRLDHPGITYCKKGTRSIGEIIETLVLIYEVMTPEEMVGRVEFV